MYTILSIFSTRKIITLIVVEQHTYRHMNKSRILNLRNKWTLRCSSIFCRKCAQFLRLQVKWSELKYISIFPSPRFITIYFSPSVPRFLSVIISFKFNSVYNFKFRVPRIKLQFHNNNKTRFYYGQYSNSRTQNS